jgi:hypothetical protein
VRLCVVAASSNDADDADAVLCVLHVFAKFGVCFSSLRHLLHAAVEDHDTSITTNNGVCGHVTCAPGVHCSSQQHHIVLVCLCQLERAPFDLMLSAPPCRRCEDYLVYCVLPFLYCVGANAVGCVLGVLHVLLLPHGLQISSSCGERVSEL